MNRVTDTCIPEEEAMRRIERQDAQALEEGDRRTGERYFPYEYMYQLIESGVIEECYQIDPKDSWVLAAVREEPADLRPGLGGLDARQCFRRATASAATSSTTA